MCSQIEVVKVAREVLLLPHWPLFVLLARPGLLIVLLVVVMEVLLDPLLFVLVWPYAANSLAHVVGSVAQGRKVLLWEYQEELKVVQPSI